MIDHQRSHSLSRRAQSDARLLPPATMTRAPSGARRILLTAAVSAAFGGLGGYLIADEPPPSKGTSVAEAAVCLPGNSGSLDSHIDGCTIEFDSDPTIRLIRAIRG